MAYVLPQSQTPQYQLHALDLGTLQEHAGSPVVVQASQRLTSGGTFVFDARYQRQRPALLESNGRIYAAFGSFCDMAPDKSRGWLLSWDAKTLAGGANTQMLNREVYAGAGQAGAAPMYLSSIWMSGWGPAADGSGGIYFATGNTQPGKFDAAFNLSESVVHVSGDLGQVVGTFTPNLVAGMDAYDMDFGAGGVMLLPDQKWANGLYPHLAAPAGKDGWMYLFGTATTWAGCSSRICRTPSYWGRAGAALPILRRKAGRAL